MTRGDKIKQSKEDNLYKDLIYTCQNNYMIEKIISDMNKCDIGDKSSKLRINLHLYNLTIKNKKLIFGAKA